MLTLFLDNFSFIAQGIGKTLSLLAISLLLGFAFSLLFSAIKYYKIKVLTPCVNVFIFCVRGTPFLVQLFLIYYGPVQFSNFSHLFFLVPFKSASFCAILTLVINTTAYTSAMFYGAMQQLPSFELDAAKSLGLSTWHIYLHIILPRFLTRIFPIYKNEVIMLLKCTALVSTITVLDIMGVMQQLMTQTYQTIPCLLIAGFIYLILTLVFNTILNALKLKLSEHRGSSLEL